MRVHQVGFAAIKGTRHVTRPAAHLTAHGAVGDRRFAVADPSTSHVMRTVAHPSLARVEARVRGDQLTLRFPGGTEVSGATDRVGPPVPGDYWGRPAALHPLDGALDEWVSSLLGRPAAVFSVDPGQVVWGAPISMVTTGALQRLEVGLRKAGRYVPVDLAERFRANLTLEAAADPAVGERWRVGAAVLEVVGPIDRCAVVDADPATGDRQSGILTALGPGVPTFGVAARVVEPGTVATGDPVVPE